MTWTYTQDKGELLDPNGRIVATGYSGNTTGLNNPAEQYRVGVGPIPQGLYTIGAAHTPIDHLGPLALPLYPDPTNQMHGRSGFFMHGDNQALNHTASNGCIIMPRPVRQRVADNYVRQLRVIATHPSS